MTALVSTGSCLLPVPDRKPPASDAVLALYRDDHLKPLVLDYYSQLTQDREVALAILDACDQLSLNPSLGFSLAWNESHFNPKAVNYNPTTTDRGLFQLNSRTFPGLGTKAVFNPKLNALHGLSYYKMALAKLGSEEKALGFYNSGIGLLTDRALPSVTQAYVKKILADRSRMDRDAIAWLYFSHDTRLALR